MTNVSKLPDPTATLTLTATMLDKSIIDANATVRKLALYLGVDYSKMVNGERVVQCLNIYDQCTKRFAFFQERFDLFVCSR